MNYKPIKDVTDIPGISNQQTNMPSLPTPDDSNNNLDGGWRVKDNSWLQMAYGGSRTTSNAADIETRLQRLETGQKVVRRGRILPSTPQFNSQSVISTTSANNPFVANQIKGANFPPGTVPDSVAPTTNSSIRYPRVIDQV